MEQTYRFDSKELSINEAPFNIVVIINLGQMIRDIALDCGVEPSLVLERMLDLIERIIFVSSGVNGVFGEEFVCW